MENGDTFGLSPFSVFAPRPRPLLCTLVHMGYLLLAGAIAAEVAGTTAMKYSEGFSRLVPSLLTALAYVLSFALLAQTLKLLAVGTAYAIWLGWARPPSPRSGSPSWARG
ncbi:hypothetical protein STENM36S_04305 [Streptomyces tendae]